MCRTLWSAILACAVLLAVPPITAVASSPFISMKELQLDGEGRGLCFTSDGRYIVVMLAGYRAVYVDTATWTVGDIERLRAALDCSALPASLFAIPGSRAVIDPATWRSYDALGSGYSVCAVSPDGSWLATSDGHLHVDTWDLRTCQRTHDLYLQLDPTRTKVGDDLAFTPDGKTLVASGWRATAVWDVASGEVLGQFEYDGYGATLSPDGLSVAVYKGPSLGTSPGRVALYRLPQGFEASSFVVGEPVMGRLSFSVDGQFLMVPVGPVVEIYAVATGKKIATLDADPVVAAGAAASPDMTRLASLGQTGRLVVWDISVLSDYSCTGFTIAKVDWGKGCITIKNTTPDPLDLLGWRVSDGDKSYTFETSIPVGAGASYVACQAVYNPSKSSRGLVIDTSDEQVTLYSPEICGGARESTKRQ